MIGDSIRLGEVLSADLVGLYYDGDKALWAKQRLRKAHTCQACRKSLTVGEYAFAPVAGKLYRSSRICRACIERVVREGVIREGE